MPFRVGPWEIILLLIIAVFVILPFWKIFAKAGFSGWLSLTQVVPFLNIFMLFFLAFAQWPVHRELSNLKGSSDAV